MMRSSTTTSTATATAKAKLGRHRLRHDREDLGYSRTVSYNSRSHWHLITQKWGSINTKIAPFLVVNALLATAVISLLHFFDIDLTISEFGHEFMSVLLAFLVINKLQFTLEVYYEIHTSLCAMNQALIDVTQLACSFTKNESGAEYQQWRSNVAYQCILLNRVTTAMVYDGGQLEVSKMSQFDDDPLILTLDDEDNDNDVDDDEQEGHGDSLQRGRVELPPEMYIMGLNLKSDRNLRVPCRVSQRLQEVIVDHEMLPTKLDPIREMQILERVKDYMQGYREYRKILTAPLPLPWVQLARIFVFAYCFTLPFALFDRELDLGFVQSFFILLIVTYGFIGCELLYVELDDAFGDDANDLPVVEESEAAITDILLSLASVDGINAARNVRKKVPFSILDLAKFYGNKLTKTHVLKSKEHTTHLEEQIKKATGNKETDPLLKK
mmetsp:Transcript_28501/g.69364  ORF Transcript_28501/g.69364 Transcript_28501/m.69364 type:complete len:440 (+) Transcript_28501:20-1339(+)